jgi:hypothetical protein
MGSLLRLDGIEGSSRILRGAEMKRLALVLSLAAVTVAACAQKPESIAPAYVSPMTFVQHDCQQLAEEARRIDAALVTASAQQNKARSNDTVGVIFLGLPVSTLSGSNVADQIASLKGQKQTLEQTQISKRCSRA